MLVNGSFSVATDFTKNSCSGFSQKKPGNLKQEHHEREEGCRKARLGVGGKVPESEAWSGRKSAGKRGLEWKEEYRKTRLGVGGRCRKTWHGVGGRVPETEAWSGEEGCRKPRLGLKSKATR